MPQIGDDWHGDDETLAALINRFEEIDMKPFADAIRHVRGAYRIKTSDLVGADNMIGARVSFVDGDGVPHRAIVIEPEVSGTTGPCYDPYRDAMVDPSDYPLGTVQLIRGDGWEFGTDEGFFDRLQSDSDGRGLVAETSVVPAKSPESTYCYFAGWEYADNHRDD